MTELEAIQVRTSRRSYQSTPIEQEKIDKLRSLIEECNAQSGLHIQFVEDGSAAFSSFTKSYGMFSGVRSLFAMVADVSDPHHLEKIGYFGERLVLRATMLGLATCWVGGSFDRSACPCELRENEKLVCVITVGYATKQVGIKERSLYRLTHLASKKVDQLYSADQTPPDWIMEGVKAVSLAPSAINRKPVRVRYIDGRVLIGFDKLDVSCFIDLGIAKYHFELAAGGRFPYGNNAPFEKRSVS